MNLNSQRGKPQAFFTTIGIVEDTNDPAQMGRVRVYCPSIDNEDHLIDDLPWTIYASPFAGAIKNMAMGPEKNISYGPTSYGFWAIPQVGSSVLIQFINGDTNYRVYTHSIYPIMGNRGLPGGRNEDITKPPENRPYGPFTDSYENIEPAHTNQNLAGLDTTHFFTRGGYERQVAQALTNKDGGEGYAQNPNRTATTDLNSQTYSLTTPGHHFITLQDSPEFCRVRIKTTTGHQIIFDDTNERIYCSTNKGATYFEMDSDGHFHFYAGASTSFTTDGDFNVTAVGNFNIDAGGSINMTGADGVNITSGGDINLNSGCTTAMTAGDYISMTSSADFIANGATIQLNSAGGTAAAIASKPGIVPQHEPWNRPVSAGPRGTNWQG